MTEQDSMKLLADNACHDVTDILTGVAAIIDNRQLRFNTPLEATEPFRMSEAPVNRLANDGELNTRRSQRRTILQIEDFETWPSTLPTGAGLLRA